MSVNLGNVGVDACKALRGNPDFLKLATALHDLASHNANKTLDASSDQVVAASAYARACRDIWVAIVCAASDVRPNAVETPKLPDGKMKKLKAQEAAVHV